MPSAIDLTGHRYGRLTVLSLAGHAGRARIWHCQCDCGRVKAIRITALRSGNTTSCGCLHREIVTTHGKTGAPEYFIWRAIKQRCTNPNEPRFHDYGGRGISMCQRWADSFEAFYSDMGQRPSPSHSIDSIDNNGSYTPENCRWATPAQQYANRRAPRKRK